MDENTRNVLYRSQVIDLTTTGRRTGQLRKIEAAAQRWGRTDVDAMVRHSPLIVISVPGTDDQAASV